MKRKIKIKNVIILLILLVIITLSIVLLLKQDDKKLDSDQELEKKEVITDFKNMKLSDVEDYCKDNNIELDIIYEYNDVSKDKVFQMNLMIIN